MELTPWAASWFLPFVTPICIYVAYMDMKSMRIPNPSVVALFAVFAIVGLVALPFDVYLWHYVHLVVALLIGMGLNAGGLVGAGDAKFVAAAAPFVAIADLSQIALIFATALLAAWLAHRVAKHTAIRRMFPDWDSWTMKKDFPMGLALGPTLVVYLATPFL